jgi:hypothetical protein
VIGTVASLKRGSYGPRAPVSTVIGMSLLLASAIVSRTPPLTFSGRSTVTDMPAASVAGGANATGSSGRTVSDGRGDGVLDDTVLDDTVLEDTVLEGPCWVVTC